MLAWSKLPESLFLLPRVFPPEKFVQSRYIWFSHLCFHPKQSKAKLLLALGNHLQRALVS